MTANKNSEEQLITVDAKKLSLGLKTAFEGVSMIFDSLGADAGFDMTEKEEVKAKKSSASKSKAKENTNPEQEEKDESSNAGYDGDAIAPDTADDSASDDAVEAAETTETVEPVKSVEQSDSSAKQKEYVSSVTLDDVTKIIVQKIKKDRSNNEKIGQILKTYGVTKVGELDPKKYEAFLTDLGAL